MQNANTDPVKARFAMDLVLLQVGTRTEDSGDDKSTKLQIMCDKTSIQPAPLHVDIS